MLQRTAAAIFKMLASRILPFRRRFEKRHNRRTVLVARNIGHLTRQCERHINLAIGKIGDAIAARTDRADCNLPSAWRRH
ncbi:hypothetical protein D3C72_2377400 [compost metagenome]